jgi:hypothetical protein
LDIHLTSRTGHGCQSDMRLSFGHPTDEVCYVGDSLIGLRPIMAKLQQQIRIMC